MKLNHDQRKQLAEISGNIAVAWFSAGIVTTIFVTSKTLNESLKNSLFGLILTILFITISLKLLKNKKGDK